MAKLIKLTDSSDKRTVYLNASAIITVSPMPNNDTLVWYSRGDTAKTMGVLESVDDIVNAVSDYKTIKISKESMERFKRDKDVVGAVNRVPCPINNGADKQSGEMLDWLFDEANYVENSTYGSCGDGSYTALGFIDNVPFKVHYKLGENTLRAFCLFNQLSIYTEETITETIKKRLTEVNVDADCYAHKDKCGKLVYVSAAFYYNEDWVKENITGE